ncbi:MAG TPA: DinB family protein, partial [Chthoniobacterales bacterium]
MSRTRRWFDRKFQLGLQPEAAAEVIERLRAAPDRLEEALRGLSPEVLTRRPEEDKWSIQENAGHLLDLEPMWALRLDDYDAGAEALRPADLDNRKTHEARHNERALGELVAAFRTARRAFVERIARMSAAELSRTALHPRLRQPMSVVDHCFFVAEH